MESTIIKKIYDEYHENTNDKEMEVNYSELFTYLKQVLNEEQFGHFEELFCLGTVQTSESEFIKGFQHGVNFIIDCIKCNRL